MLRPRKMRFIEFTLLKNDMDAALEYLGKKGAIQFPETERKNETPVTQSIRDLIDRLCNAASFLEIDFSRYDEDVSVPKEAERILGEKLCSVIEEIEKRQKETELEQTRVRETINEASAFSKMDVPFSQLEQLSYLTLRLGRIDPKGITELRETLGNRAIVIPLESGNRILAASSRKGRFTLDSSLRKVSFEPISIPEDYQGIPSEMLGGLKEQLARLETELEKITAEKEALRENVSADIKRLVSSWRTALVIEEIKARFTATENIYHFSGWIPADIAREIANGLLDITGGRVAIRSYIPEEVPSVANGSEKVPVSLKHGAFVKGFEGVVFSYGAPLYGTIDPTPIVAFFFTLMFGIMFGDVGQGFLLFLSGILISKIPSLYAKFPKFATPLIAVGACSMVMGFLEGSFFANEELFVVPTRMLTGAITGKPVDRILQLLPLAELGGSLTKLLYFFGFTIGIGVIINSLGLLINIANRCILKKYEAAFFSKTGLAGLVLFWYAISIALRIILGGSFLLIDLAVLLIPIACIVFGPVIWRIITGERPILQHGLIVFIMEGFVEILETVSGNISNTVSFLRVGAFALSHAVLSFIVFNFYERLVNTSIGGSLSALLIMLIGNAIIILLEGMIVAIQVVRLQYYEFFNKFFIETGVEFAPFRFKSMKI
jgi:V/A-type H+-transporting ATPase subunit I